jgi:hypothetical protein
MLILGLLDVVRAGGLCLLREIDYTNLKKVTSVSRSFPNISQNRELNQETVFKSGLGFIHPEASESPTPGRREQERRV